jgi:hypothetical protein
MVGQKKEGLMKGRMILVMSGLLAAAVITTGCASSVGGVGYGLAPKKVGKEKIVERSGKRPEWAFENTMFVKNGILYASGFFSDAPNLGKGLEVATKLAQAKMAESIRMRLKDDFTYASEGLSVESTMLERILNTTTEEMVIRGFFQNRLHYEKKSVRTTAGTEYRYDCFALVEITAENYQAAVDDAIGRNMSGTVSESFRGKVEERQRAFFRLGDKEAAQIPVETSSEKKLSDASDASAGGETPEIIEYTETP